MTANFGQANGRFKNAGHLKCIACSKEFHSYIKTRKYCSQNCYHAGRPKKLIAEKKEKVLQTKICLSCKKEFICNHSSSKKTCSEKCSTEYRFSKAIFRNCIQCNKEFKYSKSKNRLYCSYQCHLDNGGAFRAGIEATKAIMKYGPKKDANHNEIFNELKKHCLVHDLSKHGFGLPDGLAWINEQWHLFDVKNPKTGYGRKGLNKTQKNWINQWKGGPVYLIYTIEEATQFGKGYFVNLKKEGGKKDETIQISQC